MGPPPMAAGQDLAARASPTGPAWSRAGPGAALVLGSGNLPGDGLKPGWAMGPWVRLAQWSLWPGLWGPGGQPSCGITGVAADSPRG